MGKKLNAGRAIMEALEETSGEEAVIAMMVETTHNGKGLHDLCPILGVVPTALWNWLRAKPERMAEYRNALKYRADVLVHESLEDVNTATVENVQVASLKAKHKMVVAGKWDRENYGDKPEGAFSGNVTVIVQRGVG